MRCDGEYLETQKKSALERATPSAPEILAGTALRPASYSMTQTDTKRLAQHSLMCCGISNATVHPAAPSRYTAIGPV
jgi:hypothetical protein